MQGISTGFGVSVGVVELVVGGNITIGGAGIKGVAASKRRVSYVSTIWTGVTDELLSTVSTGAM